MLYAIVGSGDPPASLPPALAAARRDRLNVLRAEGRLALVGQFPAIDGAQPGPAGYSGHLVVAEFDSLAAAGVWAREDPYTRVFHTPPVVKPFCEEDL